MFLWHNVLLVLPTPCILLDLMKSCKLSHSIRRSETFNSFLTPAPGLLLLQFPCSHPLNPPSPGLLLLQLPCSHPLPNYLFILLIPLPLHFPIHSRISLQIITSPDKGLSDLFLFLLESYQIFSSSYQRVIRSIPLLTRELSVLFLFLLESYQIYSSSYQKVTRYIPLCTRELPD